MKLAELYKEQGYLLLPRFFEVPEISRILDDAKNVFLMQMQRLGIIDNQSVSEAQFEQGMRDLFSADLQTFTNCGKHAQHLISLHRLSLDDRIVVVLRELGLQLPNICTRPLLYFNSPHLAQKEVYWRLSLHQDWRSMQGSLDAVVLWIPLVKITRALGALEIIPGSHRWGLRDAVMEDGYGRITGETNLVPTVAIEVEPGDVLFFSSFLVHQSGTNITPGIRWSCHFRYNNLAEQTFIARGFPHPYIYRPQVELITPDFPTFSDIEDAIGEARAGSDSTQETSSTENLKDQL